LPAGHAAAASADTAAPGAAPGSARAPGARPRRPRRAAAVTGEAPAGEAGAAASRDAPSRRPRYPGAGGGRTGERTAPVRQARGAERRDRRERDGRRGSQRGRGAAPQKPAEQKLYALESVVDRGFDDVEDEGAENGTRRVHWTIVKRSVADQKSGKATGARYVLQRDGSEIEFPNLGAARAAANKTIVHPEKLTMSKAEHVAARKQ
jgi:hypothetical protein